MVALALAQGGGGGVGQNPNGGGNSGQPGSNQGATTSTTSSSPSQQTPSTTSTNPWAVSSPTASATSTSTSTTSASSSGSGVQKEIIIGAVVGGLALLLIITITALCCLHRRKKREQAAKSGAAQPVTYAGLNTAFSGVPFRNHDRNLSPQQTQSLLPGATGLGIRGGAGGSSIPLTSSADTDLFLPSYAESQAASAQSSPMMSQHIHTPQYSPIDARNVSPLSVLMPPNPIMHDISPQTTGGSSQTIMENERDTMGFPVERDFEMVRLTEPVPHIPVPIVAPIPRHPLVQQDSLERVIREGMVSSPSPAISMLEPAAINPARLRVMSQEIPRESPILGNDPSHVRLLPRAAEEEVPSPMVGPTTGLGGGLGRNNTVSTVSSMGQSVISDAALDRLGVGHGVRETPRPTMNH